MTMDRDRRGEIIRAALRRLEALARRMLRCYPAVRGREQAEDVLQNALIRLDRALQSAPLESEQHFWRLAALQLRRELLDLARRHQAGAETPAEEAGKPEGEDGESPRDRADPEGDPAAVAAWAEFHEAVGALREELRAVVELLWYQGLTQEEAAAALGVSRRTVRRRWRDARVELARMFPDWPPPA